MRRESSEWPGDSKDGIQPTPQQSSSPLLDEVDVIGTVYLNLRENCLRELRGHGGSEKAQDQCQRTMYGHEV